MDTASFQETFHALIGGDLIGAQRMTLRTWLDAQTSAVDCIALIEGAGAGRPCPRCQGCRSHRCGQANGLQRFRCLACGRTYNALTGTPLARLRLKGKWLAYLQCLLDACPVRKAAEQVAVARSTSFRWRHRFIAGVRREQPGLLGSVVEADETYLLESQKGSRTLDRPARRRGGKATRRGIGREHDCILVACDRGTTTHEFVTGRGQVTTELLMVHLLPVLVPDVILISDSAKAYQAFAQRAGLTHETINLRAGVRARGAFHLQHVNGWHSRFKTWLRRFNGVASRYLANYTGWRRVLDTAALVTPAAWLRVGVAGRSADQ
ncbi:transposase-like protein [Pseudoduganella lurida]|uniref:Transposase-like protein n=1 Tax=Pseudoduganella lurida TaxID=1036180 RepID=A0A562REZ7_9BURK|nr:IS1595 family transposase [Pseudoduganella lurida]TWI67639.1 transposase-like protein [Pseudoduganella lurida]